MIEACDAALKAKKEELRLADLGIKLRDEELTALREENRELRDSSVKWYRNPWVILLAGVVVGAWVSR